MTSRGGAAQTIVLRLNEPDELFQLPTTDLFSEYRNYLTGLELALSEMRGRRSSRPVHLLVQLPQDRLTEGLSQRFQLALRRYCDHRTRYNVNEQRATRRDGFTALWIGCLLAAVGLVISYKMTTDANPEDPEHFVADHLGWVLAWIGLWYPLDTMLFSPRPFARENRDLRRLRSAAIEVVAWPDDPTVTS